MASANSTGSAAPIVYGGDEVSAIVLDAGSAFTRIGFAGDDTPRLAVPSLYGKRKNADYDAELMTEADATDVKNEEYEYYFGSNTLNRPIKDLELKRPVNEGLIEDWEGTKLLCEYAFKETLKLDDDLIEHPLLMTEQIWSSDEYRTEAMELAFESWNTPAFYMVKSPVASLFSCGKGSGLVVDIGADITTVTPVLDGLALFKTSRRSKYAGRYIDKQVLQLLGKRNITVNPWYKVASKQPVDLGEPPVFEERNFDFSISKLYHDLQVSRVVEDYKNQVARVSANPLTDDSNDDSAPKIMEFPDGSKYEFSVKEQYEITEGLFRPKEYPLEGDDSLDGEEQEVASQGKATTNGNSTAAAADDDAAKQLTDKEITDSLVFTDRSTADFSHKGISELIVESINACDVDIIPNLANNIVIVGGGSLVQGLTDRINHDLTESLSGLKVRLYAPGNTAERRFSSWIGGSILASLGTFHQLWISKKEYEEVGVSKLLEKRFR